MRKEDNEWEINSSHGQEHVNINGDQYEVSADAACLAHAILLLVDAVNDKKA